MIAFLRIHAKAVLHCFGGMDIEEGKPITEDFLCVSVLNEPDKDSFPDQIPLSFFQKHRADIIQLLPGDGIAEDCEIALIISIENQLRHIADRPYHTKNMICVFVSQKCMVQPLPRNLHLIHTPQELMADSLLYLNIYVLGLPFVFFYNLSTGIFSALGDSRTPFWFLAASSTANIAVDILFVTVFHMGVSGVAWATFLCQGVSCVLALAVITRRLREIETAGRPARFDRVILQKFLRIAVPSVLQQSFISVGNIIIQSVINGFGGGVIAGYAAGVKLNNLVITSFTTLCNGISNYTAQNLGAGKRDRIRAGFRAGIKIVWLLSLPLFALYFFAGEPLIRFFIDQPSQTAVDTGVTYLRILSPFYFIISAKLVADGILRGAELMNQFMIGTFTDLILRVVLAVVLAKTSLGATGIWCAWPIGWCTAAVLSIRFCLTGPCKNGTSRPLG